MIPNRYQNAYVVLSNHIRTNVVKARFWMYLVIFLQFPWHSRVGDDWPNSQVSKYMQWRYGDMNVEMFFVMVWSSIKDWMDGQGRFFPVAALQNQIILTSFRTDKSLAIFYGVFFCATLAIWVRVIEKVYNNKTIGTIFLLSSLIFIRFRNDFEPHIGFAQLVIWSFFWSALAMLLLIMSIDTKSIRYPTDWAAALVYLLALCQYELAILFLPTIIIFLSLAFQIRNQFKLSKLIAKIYPTIATTMCYLLFVFLYLRPKANPSGNYVTGFSIPESIKTFYTTVPASLPFMGVNMKEIFLLPNSSNMKLVFLVLAMIVILFIGKYFKSNPLNGNSDIHGNNRFIVYPLSTKLKFMSLLSMFPLILGPSLILSIQPNWWGYFDFGHTYLGVFYSEIGLATLCAVYFFRGKKEK